MGGHVELSAPLARGMRCHVEANDSSPVVKDEDQDVKPLEGDGWNNKGVLRDDL